MSAFALLRRPAIRAVLIVWGLALMGPAMAGGPVTTITTTTQPASPLTYQGADSLTYQWGQGNNTKIETFEYGGQTYTYQAVAGEVVFRRVDNANASGDDHCTLFAETTGTTRSYRANYPDDGSGTGACDMEAVMSGRTINRGVLDLFANVGTTAKNIERVDFLFSSALSAPSLVANLDKTGFVVIEKSGNNAVQVAAITAVDSNGQPSAYSHLVTVDDSGGDISYGTIPSTSAEHDFLSNSGTSGSRPIKFAEYSEELGFAFVSLDDLQVAVNTPVYGFSYFASDVDANVHDLLDYSTFPQTTGSSNNDPEDEGDLFGGTAGFFVEESLADFDGDGAIDSVDVDDDNDGILDIDEGTGDFDGDGMPNRLDLDADGDGINDLEESGLRESYQAQLDTNGDGQIDNNQLFGSNGLANVIELTPGSGVVDYDGDGDGDYPQDYDADYAQDQDSDVRRPSFLDHDSDSDGIPDVIEAGFTDANGDGIADGGDNRTNDPINSDKTFNLPADDGDSFEDYIDVDSDDDGIADVVEAGGVDEDQSARHDAVGSQPAFSQGNDGLEDANLNGLDDSLDANPLPVPDTDGDGIEDFRDLDSDNDAIPDHIEAGGVDTDADGQVDNQVDINIADGMHDDLCMVCGITSPEALPNPDTDSDGTPDFQDTDSDGDGKPDIDEVGLGAHDEDNNGVIDGDEFNDANGDGWDDNANDDLTGVLDEGELRDTDEDGIPDVKDINDFGPESCDCDSDEKFRTGVDGHGVGSFDMLLLALLGGGLLLRRMASTAHQTAGQRPHTSKHSVRVASSVFARRFLIATGLLMLAPLQAQAENSPKDRDMNKRFYIGAGLGISQLEPEAICPCYGVEDDTSAGGEVFVGMDVSRSFSVEGYYADLGSAEVHGINRQSAGEIGYQHYGISALGYIYNNRDSKDYENGFDDEGKFRREGLSLYGRLGAGVMSNSADVDYERVNDVHMHLGAGAEYGWENGFAARAEITSYDTDAKMLSLAVLKRLGEVGEDQTERVAMKPVAAPPKQQFTLGDEDGDGVPDGLDVCPMTPPGVKVNDLGCNIDRDGDGVINSKDRCHGTPAGVEVDATGCPRSRTRMAKAPVVVPAPVIPVAKRTIADQFEGVLEGVWFDHNSDRLTSGARQVLDEAASALRAHPSVNVVVVGHTCAGGTPAHNKDLSTRRARTVARYLARSGVRGSRLRYTGKGATMPLASNATPEGMARNRRVEFVTRGFQ